MLGTTLLQTTAHARNLYRLVLSAAAFVTSVRGNVVDAISATAPVVPSHWPSSHWLADCIIAANVGNIVVDTTNTYCRSQAFVFVFVRLCPCACVCMFTCPSDWRRNARSGCTEPGPVSRLPVVVLSIRR